MHRLIAADVWATRGTTWDVKMQLSLARLSPELETWLRGEKRHGREVTECGILRAEQFGSMAHPKFALKGSETNWFMEHLVMVVLPAFRDRLGPDGHEIDRAGHCLMKLLTAIRLHPRVFPVAAIQDFHDSAKAYLGVMRRMGVQSKPKDHFLKELSDRIGFLGSPALYACWVDESLNRLLRDVAGGAHASVHDRRVLSDFGRAHDAQRQASKRRRVS